jgi:hypothetical protein
MALTKVTRATTLIKDGWGAFNTLIDDLLSVASGKGASQVGIYDSAGNMSATNVEDALAEVYTDHSTTKALAETFDENSATTTGLVWGYKGGLFRLDAVVTTVAAGTIALTDDATNYLEIDPDDGLVKKNTTAFTSLRIPIRTVITASGSQTTSTDKRAWFAQIAGATAASAGIIELATDAEFITGTATDRTITPANAKLLTTKGGDLTSEDPLVIDTDGSYFDVTGTTNFASMTVAANRFFTLQFDGILTMTHHATNLDLPGGANITTAAGDVGIFQSTGANTVQCISYTKVDGTSIVNASIATDVTWAAAGDLVQGTGNDAAAVLTKGGSLALLRMNSGATAVEWGTGGQIAFPATAVPSADPNTLDDYEEGTYTAALTCGTSGTITLLADYDTLSYRFIGDIVFVWGTIIVSSVNAPVGELRLSIPVTAGAGTERSNRSAGSVVYDSITALTTAGLVIYGIESQDYTRIYNLSTTGLVPIADKIAANTMLGFGFNYHK